MLFRSEARAKVLAGAAKLADAVRVTLGPRSKSILIDRRWGRPLVCNDGVTVAREVELPDAEENLGVKMLREAAERTGDAVGDGTTTATLVAYALLADGVRNVEAGASAIDLKRGLDRGLGVAVGVLRARARPVASAREREQIATLAAHNDPAAGALVAQALERVGPEGVVTVEEAKGTETTLEVVEGMQFDRGYLSPYFVTDPERMEVVLEDVAVLLVEQRLAVMPPLLPLLEHVLKAGRSLLVVAEDVEGEALATLVVNRLRGTLRCVAVKAPGFGDRRRAMLEDLAVLTGGQLVSEDLGARLDQVSPEVLGRCRRVVVTRDATTLVGGGGERSALDGRTAQLRRDIAETKSDYDREKLRERLARLAGGVAVLRVGAPSEAELKARKDAFDDAISAARAAGAEGVVPGAGLALLQAVPALEAEAAQAQGDARTGLLMLRHALETPTRQVALNSGADPGVVVEHMSAGGGRGARGFDAATGRYVDLVEAGIIDPVKVLRVALENAVSVAGTLLLSEGTLTELPEPRPRPGPPTELEP